MTDSTTVWLFGYGSIIFKADFPYRDRRTASIDGWQRRFWQASHDHRGTPGAPGRVVTLVENEHASCVGTAYCIDTDVFSHLDHREKDGYARVDVRLGFAEGDSADGVMYVAGHRNPSFLGPAPAREIAAQISERRGPSGTNLEYFVSLRAALLEMGVVEDHLERIAKHIRSSPDAGRLQKRRSVGSNA